MKALTLLIFSTLSLAWTNPLSAEGARILFVCDPHRPDEMLKIDAIAIAKEIRNASQGDLVEGIDVRGKNIFRLDLVHGTSRLETSQKKNKALATLHAYYMVATQRASTSSDTLNDVAAIFASVAEKLRFSSFSRPTYVIIFNSGMHEGKGYTFQGCFPGDEWITLNASPFSHIGTIPARVVMVVDPREFISLAQADSLRRFYALLISHHSGALVGYGSHDHIREIIAQGIATPVVRDLHLRPAPELFLHSPAQILQQGGN